MRGLGMILVVVLGVGPTDPELVLDKVHEPSILSRFTVAVLRKHFGSVRKMAVNFLEQSEEVAEIVKGVTVPVTLNAEEVPIQDGLDTREPPGVVILLEESADVSDYLSSNLWNSETTFLLTASNPNDALAGIFQIFWQNNVVNVFAMTPTPNDVLVHGYVPFNSNGCDKLTVSRLDSDELGLKNRVGNLNGCVLNVSVVDLPPMVIFRNNRSRKGTFSLEGTETNAIYEVAKKLNFRAWFSVARDGGGWGWIRPSPHGAVGEVYTKHSHLGFGLLASTLERYECLDMIGPASPLRECITWAVPVGAGEARPAWLELYAEEFSGILWACIGLGFGLAASSYWFLAKVSIPEPRETVLMYIFSSFMSVPVKSPRRDSLRAFFLGWIWYSFIVLVSYQALMGSKLTVPRKTPEVETVADLLKSDLRITGLYNTFRLISFGAEGDLLKVVDRFKTSNYTIKDAIEMIAIEKKMAYLRETTSLEYYSMIDTQARGKIHVMEECVYQYYPIVVLQRNSPLTKKVNEIIGKLFESGIMRKWRNHYIYEVLLPPATKIRLSIDQMETPFVILILGNVFSTLIFLIEHILCYAKKSFSKIELKESEGIKSQLSATTGT